MNCPGNSMGLEELCFWDHASNCVATRTTYFQARTSCERQFGQLKMGMLWFNDSHGERSAPLLWAADNGNWVPLRSCLTRAFWNLLSYRRPGRALAI